MLTDKRFGTPFRDFIKRVRRKGQKEKPPLQLSLKKGLFVEVASRLPQSRSSFGDLQRDVAFNEKPLQAFGLPGSFSFLCPFASELACP